MFIIPFRFPFELSLYRILAENVFLQAYKDWLKRHPAEQKLPSFSLTPEQLFFVAFAQVCITNSSIRLATSKPLTKT